MSTTSQQLVVVEPENALTVFTKEGAIEPYIEKVRQEVAGFVGDVSTAAGRALIASTAYKVRQVKAYLESEGKKLADEQKKVPKLIDGVRKYCNTVLDAIADQVRKPLDDWEAAETARVDAHKLRLDNIANIVLKAEAEWDTIPLDRTRCALEKVKEVVVDDSWEEFKDSAAGVTADAIRRLTAVVVRREKHDADQAELAKLRADAEKHAQIERDRKIAEEAKERGRREEREKLQREQKKLQEQKDQLIRDAAAADEKAKQAWKDKEAEEKRVRDKLSAEQKAEEDAATARETDKRHRAAVIKAAVDALIDSGSVLARADAKRVIELIASGGVPRVTISY